VEALEPAGAPRVAERLCASAPAVELAAALDAVELAVVAAVELAAAVIDALPALVNEPAPGRARAAPGKTRTVRHASRAGRLRITRGYGKARWIAPLGEAEMTADERRDIADRPLPRSRVGELEPGHHERPKRVAGMQRAVAAAADMGLAAPVDELIAGSG
jgi:hypothetical protein